MEKRQILADTTAWSIASQRTS